MPSSDPVQRFSDIIEAIDRIGRFTASMDLNGFADNEQTVLAVNYSLLIISEAATKLDNIAVTLCPDIPGEKSEGSVIDFGMNTTTSTSSHLVTARTRSATTENCLSQRSAYPGTGRPNKLNGRSATPLTPSAPQATRW